MIARRLGDRPSPTADLYLFNALGETPGLRRRSHTVVETDEAVIVFRHDAGAPVSRGERRRLIYVLDDAIFLGLRDPYLPLGYRAKLALVDCAAARRLLPRAEAVVVSTPEVAEAIPARLPPPGVAILETAPYWRESPSTLEHHACGTPFRVGFSGGQTHGPMLSIAAPAFAAVLAAHPDATVLIPSGHRAPRALARHPRLQRGGGCWRTYREALPSLRRHVSLYPTPDTPFGRARSINKLIEHAVLGVAAIYSENWPRAAIAAEAGACLTAPNRADAWRDAALTLASDRDLARRLAERAAALAARLNDPAPQRALWRHLLGMR